MELQIFCHNKIILSHVKGVWTSCFSFFVIGAKIGISLPMELLNGKSMGHKNSKSSIAKSSIILYSPIIIMGNLWDIFTLFQLVMGNLWNSTVSISHIISIDKEDQENVALLWHRYGKLIPIAHP